MKVKTHDGLYLDVMATEQAHRTTVVFVNALGIASAVTEHLARSLFASGLNFVTWDRRGLPGPYDERYRQYSLQDQVFDLSAVISRLAPKNVVISAWCTGIQTALAFAKGKTEKELCGLVLFNSPNYFGSRYSGVSGDAIGKVSRILVEDESKLDFLYHSIFANNTDQVGAKITGLSDRRLQQLVEAPFKSGPEVLLRYAHLIHGSSKSEVTNEWCADIVAPIHIVGGCEDSMVAFQDSVSLAGIMPSATVEVIADWGHYHLFSDTERVAKIFTSFLARGATTSH